MRKVHLPETLPEEPKARKTIAEIGEGNVMPAPLRKNTSFTKKPDQIKAKVTTQHMPRAADIPKMKRLQK